MKSSEKIFNQIFCEVYYEKKKKKFSPEQNSSKAKFQMADFKEKMKNNPNIDDDICLPFYIFIPWIEPLLTPTWQQWGQPGAGGGGKSACWPSSAACRTCPPAPSSPRQGTSSAWNALCMDFDLLRTSSLTVWKSALHFLTRIFTDCFYDTRPGLNLHIPTGILEFFIISHKGRHLNIWPANSSYYAFR
jgi:hypothetical protein